MALFYFISDRLHATWLIFTVCSYQTLAAEGPYQTVLRYPVKSINGTVQLLEIYIFILLGRDLVNEKIGVSVMSVCYI